MLSGVQVISNKTTRYFHRLVTTWFTSYVRFHQCAFTGGMSLCNSYQLWCVDCFMSYVIFVVFFFLFSYCPVILSPCPSPRPLSVQYLSCLIGARHMPVHTSSVVSPWSVCQPASLSLSFGYVRSWSCRRVSTRICTVVSSSRLPQSLFLFASCGFVMQYSCVGQHWSEIITSFATILLLCYSTALSG